MNIEIPIDYKKMVEWLTNAEDTPLIITINLPCTCTKDQVHVRNVSNVMSNVPETALTSSNVDSTYILKELSQCNLPKHVKNIPSFIRNINLIKILNDVDGVYHLKLCKEKDGYRAITAIDEQKKVMLITSSDITFIESPKVQDQIEHFFKLKYDQLLWCNEKLYSIEEKHQSLHSSSKEP